MTDGRGTPTSAAPGGAGQRRRPSSRTVFSSRRTAGVTLEREHRRVFETLIVFARR